MGLQRRVGLLQAVGTHLLVAEARVPVAKELLDRVGPRLRYQQFELHRAEPLFPGPAFREGDELPTYADAAMLGTRDQHPELAPAAVEPLDAHGADQPAVQPGDNKLPRR